MTVFRSAGLSLTCLVVVAAGCGKARPPTTIVDGSVTLGGKPLANGTISFVSQENTGGSAAADLIAGRYQAKDVPRGKVLVYLYATRTTGRMVGSRTNKYAPPQPEIVNIIPEQYRAGVLMDVSGERMRRDFEL